MTVLLNLDSLNELKGLLEDELYTITQLFADQLPSELAQLALAVASGDMSAISSQAHAIKGSCANMGAVELARQAMLIEKTTQSGNQQVIEETASGLPGLAEQTLQAMRESGFLRG